MIEKCIDLLAVDAEYQIRKHIANGWYIHHLGLTIAIMRKEINDEKNTGFNNSFLYINSICIICC